MKNIVTPVQDLDLHFCIVKKLKVTPHSTLLIPCECFSGNYCYCIWFIYRVGEADVGDIDPDRELVFAVLYITWF